MALATVDILQSMGWNAEVRDGKYGGEGARAGQDKLEVHIKTGAPVNVFLDLSGDEPKYFSFANFTSSGIAKNDPQRAKYIETQKDGGLEKYNREKGMEFGRRYEGKMLLAYAAAESGLDANRYAKIFKLEKYKGAEATADADLGENFDAATDFQQKPTGPVPTVSKPVTGMSM